MLLAAAIPLAGELLLAAALPLAASATALPLAASAAAATIHGHACPPSLWWSAQQVSHAFFAPSAKPHLIQEMLTMYRCWWVTSHLPLKSSALTLYRGGRYDATSVAEVPPVNIGPLFKCCSCTTASLALLPLPLPRELLDRTLETKAKYSLAKPCLDRVSSDVQLGRRQPPVASRSPACQV